MDLTSGPSRFTQFIYQIQTNIVCLFALVPSGWDFYSKQLEFKMMITMYPTMFYAYTDGDTDKTKVTVT